MTCRRCRSTAKPTPYVDPDGAVTLTCADCHHPVPGDPALIHDLLNRRPMPAHPAKACQSCGRAVLDAPLCSTCIKDVRRWLRQVPTLAVELDLTIARQTRFAEQVQRVTGTAVPPLPLHVEAAAARDDLRAVLVSWVKFEDEEMAG